MLRTEFFETNKDIKSMYDDILAFNEKSSLDSWKARFNSIKEYAIRNSPFYSSYTIDDEFPVMSKLDLIHNHNRIFVPAYKNTNLHRSSTSGSTGIPLTIEQDELKRKRTIADLKAYGVYACYQSHERMLQLRAYCGKSLDRHVDLQNNIWRYDITNLTEDNMIELVELINAFKPTILFGYDSTIDAIGRFMLNNGITLEHQCSSILVGGEMLSEDVANRIAEAFRCPIFDRYSNQEMGIYAQREYGKTLFRFNIASYYLEILQIDSNKPASEGEIGRIVVTDLNNKAFPMLRYDTGDLGSYVIVDGKVFLKEVLGRRVDVIFDTKGRARQPHMITNMMWGVDNVMQWQFIQKARKQYTIRIIPSGNVDESGIIQKLLSILGRDASITIEYVDAIPLTNSQKTRYILNEMQ